MTIAPARARSAGSAQLGQRERRDHVDLVHLAQRVERVVGQRRLRARPEDAGVVDQQVERRRGRLGRGDQGGPVRRVGDVAGHRARPRRAAASAPRRGSSASRAVDDEPPAGPARPVASARPSPREAPVTIATGIAGLLSMPPTLGRAAPGGHRAAGRPRPRSLDLGPPPDPAAPRAAYRAGGDRLRPGRAARGERRGARRDRAPVGARGAADDRRVGAPAARRPLRRAGRARRRRRRSPSSSPTAITDEQWAAIGPLPRQHGLLGADAARPDPVRLADIRAHPRFAAGGRPPTRCSPTSSACRSCDGDEILGELFLANKREPGGFTADDEELLRLLAAHAAIALVNARLYERSRELSIVEERHRIARELHDAVTQKLFSLRLTAEAAATLRRRATPTRAAEQLDTVRAAGRRGDRRAARDRGRPAPGRPGRRRLAVALRKQAELLDRVHAADGRASPAGAAPRGVTAPPGGGGRLPHRAGGAAQRAAARRRPTHQVDAAPADGDGRCVLSVTDDGRGLRPRRGRRAAARRRLGLASMRERAAAAGGRLDGRRRGRAAGTTVRLGCRTDG